MEILTVMIDLLIDWLTGWLVDLIYFNIIYLIIFGYKKWSIIISYISHPYSLFLTLYVFMCMFLPIVVMTKLTPVWAFKYCFFYI